MSRYMDFFTSFLPHPDTGQLLFKTNERAISQSIRNILLTNRGERPFEKDSGANIRAMLFDQFESHTEDVIRDHVFDALKQDLRIQVNAVFVRTNEEIGAVFISIEYVYAGSSEPVRLDLTLSRVR